MTEFFDFLKHLETSLPTTTSKESPPFERAVTNRGFKTVILVCLLLSIVIQILVASRFYDKFRMLESHFSPYPVIKPVEVALEVAIPQLVEINRHIDRLTQQLDRRLETQGAFLASQGNSKAEIPPSPVRKEAKPRQSNQAVVVEKLKN